MRTGTHRGLLSAIWVLVAQWLERLTGDQKVAGSIPVWGSEAFFWVCNKAWVANSFPLIYQAASIFIYIYIYIYIYWLVFYTEFASISSYVYFLRTNLQKANGVNFFKHLSHLKNILPHFLVNLFVVCAKFTCTGTSIPTVSYFTLTSVTSNCIGANTIYTTGVNTGCTFIDI